MADGRRADAVGRSLRRAAGRPTRRARAPRLRRAVDEHRMCAKCGARLSVREVTRAGRTRRERRLDHPLARRIEDRAGVSETTAETPPQRSVWRRRAAQRGLAGWRAQQRPSMWRASMSPADPSRRRRLDGPHRTSRAGAEAPADREVRPRRVQQLLGLDDLVAVGPARRFAERDPRGGSPARCRERARCAAAIARRRSSTLHGRWCAARRSVQRGAAN